MKVELSRRRFLQGSVALSVIGGTVTTSLFSSEHETGKDFPKKITTNPHTDLSV